MDKQTDGKTQNMLVDHLFQCRVSPWPITAEKHGFRTCVTDRRTDGRTDQRMDRPSYRDAFLMDASLEENHSKNYPFDHATITRIVPFYNLCRSSLFSDAFISKTVQRRTQEMISPRTFVPQICSQNNLKWF